MVDRVGRFIQVEETVFRKNVQCREEQDSQHSNVLQGKMFFNFNVVGKYYLFSDYLKSV